MGGFTVWCVAPPSPFDGVTIDLDDATSLSMCSCRLPPRLGVGPDSRCVCNCRDAPVDRRPK